MRILVSGSTKTVAALAGRRWFHRLGVLLTPGNWNTVESVLATGLPWGIDNGAYSGFDPAAFRRLVARAAGQPRLLWVVCPDVVADSMGTLALFREWEPELRSAGVPVAFVLQNGQRLAALPDADCYFLGGSPECRPCGYARPGGERRKWCSRCGRRLTEWKEGGEAARLAAEAKRRGALLHMGRVNSLRRLAIALSWGCDSVDGSGYSRFAAVARAKGRTDMMLERHLAFVEAIERRETECPPQLFGG